MTVGSGLNPRPKNWFTRSLLSQHRRVTAAAGAGISVPLARCPRSGLGRGRPPSCPIGQRSWNPGLLAELALASPAIISSSLADSHRSNRPLLLHAFANVGGFSTAIGCRWGFFWYWCRPSPALSPGLEEAWYRWVGPERECAFFRQPASV